MYLDSHWDLSEMEREKVYSALSYRRRSEEAYEYVAKNERLPMRFVA